MILVRDYGYIEWNHDTRGGVQRGDKVTVRAI